MASVFTPKDYAGETDSTFVEHDSSPEEEVKRILLKRKPSQEHRFDEEIESLEEDIIDNELGPIHIKEHFIIYDPQFSIDDRLRQMEEKDYKEWNWNELFDALKSSINKNRGNIYDSLRVMHIGTKDGRPVNKKITIETSVGEAFKHLFLDKEVDPILINIHEEIFREKSEEAILNAATINEADEKLDALREDSKNLYKEILETQLKDIQEANKLIKEKGIAEYFSSGNPIPKVNPNLAAIIDLFLEKKQDLRDAVYPFYFAMYEYAKETGNVDENLGNISLMLGDLGRIKETMPNILENYVDNIKSNPEKDAKEGNELPFMSKGLYKLFQIFNVDVNLFYSDLFFDRTMDPVIEQTKDQIRMKYLENLQDAINSAENYSKAVAYVDKERMKILDDCAHHGLIKVVLDNMIKISINTIEDIEKIGVEKYFSETEDLPFIDHYMIKAAKLAKKKEQLQEAFEPVYRALINYNMKKGVNNLEPRLLDMADFVDPNREILHQEYGTPNIITEKNPNLSQSLKDMVNNPDKKYMMINKPERFKKYYVKDILKIFKRKKK